MPVCKQCTKFSNCLTVDSCEFCGAKDWIEPKIKVASGGGEFKKAFAALGMIVLIGLGIVITFGLFWAFIAIIHWMWNHS